MAGLNLPNYLTKANEAPQEVKSEEVKTEE